MAENATVGGSLAAVEPGAREERRQEKRQALSMLVGADLHESTGGLDWFRAQALAFKPDMVVFLGDFVTGGPLGFIREVLRELRELAPYCFVIPGNWDPRESLPLIDKEAYDGLRNLHKATAVAAGYIFVGLGGSLPTPVETTPLEMPEDALVAPMPALLPADIWLLHHPLRGYCDRLTTGTRIGSRQLAALYEDQEPPPLLVLSGHIHEAFGVEQNAATTFVNPGSLREMRAAWLKLGGGRIEVELLEG